MRLDSFWVTTDPTTRDSTLADICFETTLERLQLQFKGGLSMERHRPTLFTERDEAEAEARRRLVALRAAEAIASAAPQERMKDVARVVLLDGDGNALFEGELQ